MQGIDPKFSVYLNIAIGVLGVVATLSPSAFPGYIPAGSVSDIVKTAGLFSTLLGGMNTVLHGASSSSAGPMIKEK